MADVTIGMIGGTGPQGRGLAMRLARAGLAVRVGSRDAARGRETAGRLNETAGVTSIEGGENREIVQGADYVLLTVPFESAAETLRGLADVLQAGQVFVDVTVPLIFEKGGPFIQAVPEGSASAHLRPLVPEALPFLGAFKTLPAHLLEELDIPLDCDTFVYGDDKAAREAFMDVVRRVPTLRPVNCGGLAAAPHVEGMTALVIRLNRLAKSREGRFRVVGIEA